MRQIVLVVTLLHGAFCCATEAAEQPPLKACAIAESPWAYVDEDGTLAGIAIDLHTYFQRVTGRAILTEPCTIKRARAGLKDGSVDLALLPEVQGLSKWAQPLLPVYRARVMVLPRKGVMVQRYEDLHALTVAVPEGSVVDLRLQSDPDVEKHWVAAAGDALDLLFAQEVDAVVGNANFYRFAAAARGVDPDEFFGPPFPLGERTVWVYLSRKSDEPEFTAKLQAVFGEGSLEPMIWQLRDGYYQRAISHH